MHIIANKIRLILQRSNFGYNLLKILFSPNFMCEVSQYIKLSKYSLVSHKIRLILHAESRYDIEMTL